MDSKDKQNVWMVGLVIGGVALILSVIAGWHILIVQSYVEKGYTRTTLPGASCTYWVKDVNE